MSAVATVRAFQRELKLTSYNAGDIIFNTGEVGEVMYGLVEGEVELWVNGIVAEVIVEGDVFGEGALVQPNKVRASTAIAKTDCKLAILNQDRFLFAIQNTPMFAVELMQSFSSRLRRMKTIMAMTHSKAS